MAVKEPEARTKLAPYERLFVEAIDDAFREWEGEYAALRIDHTARTQSSLIHDLIVKHLRIRLSSMSGVRLTEQRGRTLVVVLDEFVISIKKLDNRLRSSSISTGQALAFIRQEHLPGLPPATNMFIGYQYNDTRTDWDAVWVTCPAGEMIGYEWRLAAGTNVVEFPVIEEKPIAEKRQRVRRKVEHVTEDVDDVSRPSS